MKLQLTLVLTTLASLFLDVTAAKESQLRKRKESIFTSAADENVVAVDALI